MMLILATSYIFNKPDMCFIVLITFDQAFSGLITGMFNGGSFESVSCFWSLKGNRLPTP